ncbi:MAG: helix-turn-helix transcriptional regulator [Lapillicoccus sp.]
MSKLSPHELGVFLREQRQAAQLSLRQLSDLAGVSNPYLSQIERGLKKPSAEILQQLARGLQVSAESLYVHAGFLEAAPLPPTGGPGVLEAIAADADLTPRQRAALSDVYESFVGPVARGSDPSARSAAGTDQGSSEPAQPAHPHQPDEPADTAPMPSTRFERAAPAGRTKKTTVTTATKTPSGARTTRATSTPASPVST